MGILNIEQKTKICNTGQIIYKYHDKTDLVHFVPKNISTTSPTWKNMESTQRTMWYSTG